MSRGQDIIDFIEEYCYVPEGKFLGRKMKLDPFQKKFIKRVYDNKAGTRLAILSMARKNGKTALIAALCLAHIVGPEARQNSQLVSGARSRDQAALVFNLMVKMINFSEALSNRTRIIPSGKKIYGLRKNVEYQALAAEASTKHGLSPWLVIFDELGQVRGPKDSFVEALETAQGAYDDAMQIVISTQAPTDSDLLSLWIDDALTSKDPKTVVELHAADESCDDFTDKRQWKKANPALGTFRSLSEMTEMAKKADRMPSFESSFRNLYLNQRVNDFAPFVSKKTWKANGSQPVLDFAGQGDVFGGIDLSATTDLTSAVFTCRIDGKKHVLPFFWMPERLVSDATKRDKFSYDLHVRNGLIRTTPGVVIDYDFVARDLATITKGWELAMIGFDRWRMDRLMKALDDQGIVLPVKPWGQGFKDMTPALDALEKDLLTEGIKHGNNPVLAMCAANAVEVPDPAGNRKLDKAKSTGRIDGIVALAIAAGVEAEMMAKPVEIYIA